MLLVRQVNAGQVGQPTARAVTQTPLQCSQFSAGTRRKPPSKFGTKLTLIRLFPLTVILAPSLSGTCPV
jgi:hypothetical protein